MAEVLPEFIANLSEEVCVLYSLLEKKDLAGLRVAVHQIKGAGGSYGFQVLSDAAKVAESSLIAGAPIDAIQSQGRFAN